jgi:putative hydrolase of the HAD superfamily
MRPSMSIATILFDLDNTLTDRKRSIHAFSLLFYRHFADQLKTITPDRLERIMQLCDGGGYRPKEIMFSDLVSRLPWFQSPTADTMREFWYTRSPRCMKGREGLHETLQTLRERGFRLGIITNGQAQAQNATIDAIGVRDYMDTVVVSETVGYRKPDPTIFKLALQKLNAAPSTTLFVGDHPLNDVFGAVTSGIVSVWLSDGFDWPGHYPEPEFQISSLPELVQLVTPASV